MAAEPSEKPMSEREEWPRITLVTPNLNQGDHLERTLCSVLEQDYPNLEYMVIDGGSSDQSLSVIHKYQRALSYWVSEKDSGQSQAINKGFERATGSLMGWLNADDRLEPGALRHVAGLLGPSCPWISGAAAITIPKKRMPVIRTPKGSLGREKIFPWHRGWFAQPATFWTRELWEKAGPLDEGLHYVMDYDLWLRMSRHAEAQTTPRVLAQCFLHQGSKSYTQRLRVYHEMFQVMCRSVRRDERKKLPAYAAGLAAKCLWDAAAGFLKLGKF